MRWITFAAVACGALLAFPAVGAAKTVRAKVVRVTDGDSVRVKAGKRTRTYGLLGVNAPERGECFARQAKRRLRSLLPRQARVRLVTEKGAGRRQAYVYRGRRLVNAAMLASGHARAVDTADLRRGTTLERAAERGSDRGLWTACGEEETGAAPPPAPAPPPPAAPPADKKQQDIAEMDRQLQGVRVYTVKTEGGETREQTAHLCPDHRFLYVLQTSFDGTPIAPTQATGTWKVADAFIDPATGVRQALVETLADGEAEPVRTLLHINADGVSGQWDGQSAGFSRSEQCG